MIEFQDKNGNQPDSYGTKQEIETGNSYDVVKPSKKRYLILLLFCLHSMINSAQWIYLSSITNIVTKFYQVDNIAVNWTSMVYMLVYIPLVVPATCLFERLGMRKSILLGSFGTSLGAVIKCFSCSPDMFYLLMTGQTLVAISQLFVLSVPPRLASIWFPDNQVSLANACGIFGNQFGIALGFLLPQYIIGEPDPSPANMEAGLLRLFRSVAVVSSTFTILILCMFDEAPKRPPGIARLQQIKRENLNPLVSDERVKHPFSHLLWSLCKDKNYVLLFMSYGLNVGVFYAISTVLNQMVAPRWPNNNTLVARLGLTMIISGMFGSFLSGYILDKTRRYRLVNICLYGLSLLSMIFFTIAIEMRLVEVVYFSVVMLGYFMTGYLIIGFELSNEITWPYPESITAGMLNLSAQVFGVGLTYAGSFLVDRLGNMYANLFFIAGIFVGFNVTMMIKAQMKRQNAIEAKS